MGLSISTREQRTETGRWEGVGLRTTHRECKFMEIIEKSMKIGDKRVPRRAASHFNLRTTGRVGAVGGGRGREVYLLN